LLLEAHRPQDLRHRVRQLGRYPNTFHGVTEQSAEEQSGDVHADHGSVNLCAAFYNIGRWLFLRDAGRKLSHLDRQLRTRDAVLHDLHRDLKM
jgi:hypothetical protein